jgi:branched-chain amino acid transport system ATP-binding protein
VRTPLLDVAGLGKRFGRVVVAEDVSFSMAEGEVLGVVGPNGAGKSTLLNLISGVLAPEQGRIRLGGHDVTRRGAAARARAGIGRTYQIPRPFAKMTVFENALVGATFAGRRRGEASALALAALRRTGLLAHANAPAGTLPLLDRKRLELARALASRPTVLLLDEIAGGLAEHEVPQLIDLVRELRDEHVAVIWIEHVVHALLSGVDRLMCLSEGRVLAIGDPHEVMSSQLVRDVYLGTDPDLEMVQ